jgi:lipoprotein-anchoring transpeptidase ErfK/SrfK
MMMGRFGLYLLALPVAAAVSAAGAQAQYYSGSSHSYYGSGQRSGSYEDGLPAPGYDMGDDEDAPPARRRYSQNPQQSQPGAPSNILPVDDPAPAQSGANSDGRPNYGHQLDAQPAGSSAAKSDSEVMRPPGSIGTGPSAAPAPIPPAAAAALPPEDQPEVGQPKELPPNLKKQLVDYQTKEPAGTIIVDTPNTYLYLVLGGGKAMRYGIGVGREGFTWAGTERISRMKEWPDWFPPSEMIERQPYLPRFMAGGPGNPLGARALYLGKTLYRIHGTNQPSTIGQTVSSGCIRLINGDIEDLFSRVQVGSRVVVLPGRPPDAVANAGNAPSAEPANPMAPPAHTGTNAGTTAGSNAGTAGTAVSSSPLPPVR